MSGHSLRARTLILEVASDEALSAAVDKHVHYLLKAGPKALAQCKRLVLEQTPGISTEDTVDLIARLRVSAEGQEGMAAFFEKRKPSWTK